jgi:GNAT superfamily N-acetyltransferase
MLVIRLATADDVAEIVAFDRVAEAEQGRRDHLRRVVAAQTCYVAIEGSGIAGYLVLEYSFFEQGFLALLYVAEGCRRQGVGSALMQHAEAICTTPKLFTSTNLSNHPMQELLSRRGYKLSGTIHDLDEGDPELIYVKYLREG